MHDNDGLAWRVGLSTASRKFRVLNEAHVVLSLRPSEAEPEKLDKLILRWPNFFTASELEKDPYSSDRNKGSFVPQDDSSHL